MLMSLFYGNGNQSDRERWMGQLDQSWITQRGLCSIWWQLFWLVLPLLPSSDLNQPPTYCLFNNAWTFQELLDSKVMDFGAQNPFNLWVYAIHSSGGISLTLWLDDRLKQAVRCGMGCWQLLEGMSALLRWSGKGVRNQDRGSWRWICWETTRCRFSLAVVLLLRIWKGRNPAKRAGRCDLKKEIQGKDWRGWELE